MAFYRLCLFALAISIAGCSKPPTEDRYAAAREAIAQKQQMMAEKKQMLMDQGYGAKEIQTILDAEFGDLGIKFKDRVANNAEPPADVTDLVFVQPSDADPKGKEVQFSDLLGKKKIVLVVMRGYSGGMICPFCVAQTAQLASKHDEFVELGAEVLIVYPGDSEHLDEFVTAATGAEKADLDEVKWPVLLDPDLSAVELLDIAADLASPSTFIFDSQGDVAFAYVGADRADRPSVQALLEQVKQLD